MMNQDFDAAAYAAFQEAALEKYDFGTCQRPDGSYYGTGGTCRKGSPVSGGVPEKDKKSSSGGAAGGGGGDVKSLKADVKRLDKDARAKDKAADKASAAWKKGGAKTGTAEHKKVKELDKAAKTANKAANAADKKYQAAAKKAQGGTKLDKASRNEYAKQAKREQQAIKDIKGEMKRNGKTPALEKKLRQTEMRAGKFDKFAKTGVFTK